MGKYLLFDRLATADLASRNRWELGAGALTEEDEGELWMDG